MYKKLKKIINFLDNKPDTLSKFRTKNWVEINDDSRGTYNTYSQVKFKTSVLKWSSCNWSSSNYNDAYIYVKGSILVVNTATADTAANNNHIELVFKNCDSFTDWISEINNIQIVNANSIWQYYWWFSW